MRYQVEDRRLGMEEDASSNLARSITRTRDLAMLTSTKRNITVIYFIPFIYN